MAIVSRGPFWAGGRWGWGAAGLEQLTLTADRAGPPESSWGRVLRALRPPLSFYRDHKLLGPSKNYLTTQLTLQERFDPSPGRGDWDLCRRSHWADSVQVAHRRAGPVRGSALQQEEGMTQVGHVVCVWHRLLPTPPTAVLAVSSATCRKLSSFGQGAPTHHPRPRGRRRHQHPLSPRLSSSGPTSPCCPPQFLTQALVVIFAIIGGGPLHL